MPITALPTPPSRDDSENFAQRADAFLGALPAFAAEANATAAEVNANAAICQSAAMVVSVTAWVSGSTYAEGVAVYDPTDFLTYRRKVPGAGATRPGLDAANWQLLTGFGNVTLDTAQTITGVKTFTQTIQGSVSGSAATAGVAADCSRSVLTSGLATGGGQLTANRTITVPAATQTQAETGSDNATAMTPLRVEQHMLANALGWGQTWETYTSAQRVTGTTYQNTTGRPIAVILWGSSGSFEMSPDGTTWLPYGGVPGSASGAQFFCVVPHGIYYRVTGSFSRFGDGWMELR